MRKISGIYCIQNIVTKKRYVGSSVSCIYTRLHIHRHSLRERKHHSRHLQHSWDKHGAKAFKMFVLEPCSKSKCIEREQYWIDHYRTADQKYGYNIAPNAGSCLGIKRSEETRAKLSKVARNRSPELLEKIRLATTTPEVLRKIGDAHRGKVLSAETRAKISASVLAKVDTYRHKLMGLGKGRKLSEEHKRKISEAGKGRKMSAEFSRKLAERNRLRNPQQIARMLQTRKINLLKKRASQSATLG